MHKRRETFPALFYCPGRDAAEYFVGQSFALNIEGKVSAAVEPHVEH
jgi:hypothetical protein